MELIFLKPLKFDDEIPSNFVSLASILGRGTLLIGTSCFWHENYSDFLTIFSSRDGSSSLSSGRQSILPI